VAVVVCSTATGAPSPGLEHLGTKRLGPRLEELRFRTPALVGETHVRVLLPAGYDADSQTRYPVLYLLHGGTGSYADWTTTGDAEELSADYPLIIVMPDASEYGGYVDWWNFGAGGPPMWETYHVRQLLPWIDSHYRTIPERDGRAIAGLSMGGGGTMHYAARHPDLFTAAAAFSGAVDSNTVPVQLLIETSGMQDGHPPGAVVGHRATEEVRWRGHNPWDLAENLRGMFLQLDTGNGMPGGPGGDTGDPIEAGVHEMMTNLHTRLDELDIPHLWNDYGAGGHAWFYWRRDLTELLPRLMERFANPVDPPSPLTYTSIDPSYEAWGWQVAIDRPALEFSRLVDASADGFQLVGSGAARVTTAPLFEPRAAVTVHVDDADGVRDIAVLADGDGALLVPVSLGPGNPQQQLSPQGTTWALTAGSVPGTWPSVRASVAFSPAPVAGPPAPAAPGSVAQPGGSERLPATGAQPPVAALSLLAAVAGSLLLRVRRQL
jgi:S-formylglutathione hydrolase FrmB